MRRGVYLLKSGKPVKNLIRADACNHQTASIVSALQSGDSRFLESSQFFRRGLQTNRTLFFLELSNDKQAAKGYKSRHELNLPRKSGQAAKAVGEFDALA